MLGARLAAQVKLANDSLVIDDQQVHELSKFMNTRVHVYNLYVGSVGKKKLGGQMSCSLLTGWPSVRRIFNPVATHGHVLLVITYNIVQDCIRKQTLASCS